MLGKASQKYVGICKKIDRKTLRTFEEIIEYLSENRLKIFKTRETRKFCKMF